MAIETLKIVDRESWLDWRKQDVTASDVAALFGLHPYKTPLGLWADKTDMLVAQTENAAMRRGRWLEDAVIAACRDHHPDWTIAKPGTYVRDTSIHLACTPDAVRQDDGTIIQCKTVADKVFRDSWQGEVPPHYQLQALTEAMLTDAPGALLAILVTSAFGADYYEFPIPRHPAAEKRIRDKVPEFWAAIDRGEAPKADYAVDGAIVAAIHTPNESLPTPLDLSRDNRIGELLERRAVLTQAAKGIEEELEQIKTEVIEKLAGHTLATTQGWKVSYKIQDRKEYTVKAASFPVLRFTAIKERT